MFQEERSKQEAAEARHAEYVARGHKGRATRLRNEAARAAQNDILESTPTAKPKSKSGPGLTSILKTLLTTPSCKRCIVLVLDL